MKVFSIAKGFHRLTKNIPPELTQKEKDRLRAIEIWRETLDAELVCKTFQMSRASFYRWLKRYDPKNIISLKDKSKRPRNIRKPRWSYELIMAVKGLRGQYPRWGKDKIAVLLKNKGIFTSASTAGRIIAYLKKTGDLIEPKRKAISARRRMQRPYAARKPKDYIPKEPGDIVQVDTLDIRPLPGIVLKQFTARDVVSKWDVVEARSRAAAKTSSEFIETLQRRMPFKIKAIQVDGGSEFCSDFEYPCKEKGINLFVLPPRSPKLNGCVERSNRTLTSEFYEVNDCSWTVNELNEKLKQWEHTYNCIRPHQSLNQKTPLQFLKGMGIIHDYKPLALSHM